MILTIDIGNTNISLGVFQRDSLILESRLAADRTRMSDQYALEFYDIFRINGLSPEKTEGSVLSSVVPELSQKISEAVEKISGVASLILAPGVKTGLNILIDDPAELGGDLAAGAVGAAESYPLPAFVVDLGTATKVYVIDEHRGFRGGAIAPGVEISLRALTKHASLLPSVSLKPPKRACGTDTAQSLRSGVVFGTADMIDGLLDRFEAELGPPASIVATGGLAPLILGVCRHELTFDSSLILRGLKAVYDKNTKK